MFGYACDTFGLWDQSASQNFDKLSFSLREKTLWEKRVDGRGLGRAEPSPVFTRRRATRTRAPTACHRCS